MIRNYFTIAWRNLWKNKLSSSLNLVCLSVGMACCMLIVIYLRDELSYNRFNSNYENIYRIDWTSNHGGSIDRVAVTPAPLGKAALAEIPQIKKLARLYQRSGGMEFTEAANKDKKFQELNVFFSDEDLFSIFSIEFLKGASEQALSAPNSVVLTDEMAGKYFGDADPVGKTLLYDTKTPLRVSAVVKKMPANSDLQFDFLVNFETLYSVELPDMAEFIRTNWTYNPVTSYCLIPPPHNIKNLEATLNDLLYKHGGERNKQMNTILLQPLPKIHLYSSDIGGNPSTSSMGYIYLFATIALLILVIAVVNFVNLATAQASTRTREVGMRKVLGAEKTQIVVQFLSESMLLGLISLCLAFMLVPLFLPVLNGLTNKALSWHSWLTLQGLALFLLICLLTSFFAGVYPAFFVSGLNPISSLKGKSGDRVRKNYLRKTLLVVQFSISILLIVGAIVVYKQLNYLRSKPLGFQKDHMLCIPIFGSGSSTLGYGVDGPMRQRMNAFCNELTKSSRIKAVTAASAMPGQWFIPGLVIPEGKSEKDNIFIHWLCVDYNFLSTFNMPLVAGRDFSKQTGTDHLSAFIINESAVKHFGWKSAQDAIGRDIIRGQESDGKKGKIIGVVKDHHFYTLYQPIQPLIMDVNVPRFSYFAAHIQPGDIPGTIALVKRQWDAMFPERVFEYSFLDSDIDALYRDNEQLSQLIGYFASIAILLSCLGLFSLSSFLTVQRTKEIGIRKVLGAGVNRILYLLSADFLKLAALALLISVPIAYYGASRWLQDFAYRITIQWWIFALAGLIVMALTAFTVALQSGRAAVASPAKSLRTE